MKEHSKYLLVDSQILPEVYLKVILAKKLLAQGKAKSASDAAKAAGISRSAFYKYKDFVHEYNTRLSDSIMTVSVSLMDEPGMLASVLSAVSGSGANILTVHQNIPTDSVAPVSISMRTNQLNCTEEEMLVRLRELPGVLDAKFVSGH
ncbi:MAG: ACT domain-containing protein [Anaerotignum sp.]|nr:ACT domain-containing protein [Oscillospiraceae bacterium]MBQ3616031.1 ACT domain-containing protein [Anaerotignum sp.]MBQ2791841.1 ACT domain-containing protein [Oscillospiraceae bacterium]MBQ3241757.1 ACT domain-containing protein [Oscillospiraceae bacterium]MBR2635722.1 ACT domain-containing protein [Oscillospiraceae bacterium]